MDLIAHLRRGGEVLGICGGYQMLGQTIADPEGIEGPAGQMQGLGLLDVGTIMTPDKRLSRVTGLHLASGLPLSGYEIHIGRTTGPDCARPFANIDHRSECAQSPDGRITGTYLHGMFQSDPFRTEYLTRLGIAAAPRDHGAGVEAALDALADHLEAHLDVPGLLDLAR